MSLADRHDESLPVESEWLRDLAEVLGDIDLDGLPEGTTFSAILEQALENASVESLSDQIAMGPRYVSSHNLYRKGFERRLRARWFRGIYLFDLFLLTACKYGSDFNSRHRTEAATRNDLLFEALTRIHGRACLVAQEVRALLVAGYASGALARWRLLHELAVVAFFIKEHDAELTERYLLHEVIVSAKAAENYFALQESQGLAPLDQHEIEAARRAKKEMVERFGSGFAGDWGWASGYVSGRPTFDKIEQAAGLGRLRLMYRMASHSIHAGYKGMAFDIGLSNSGRFNPRTIIHAGPSNAGLADPAVYATNSLMQCTVALLTYIPEPDSLSAAKMLARLYDLVEVAFMAAHKKLERDEDAIANEWGFEGAAFHW